MRIPEDMYWLFGLANIINAICILLIAMPSTKMYLYSRKLPPLGVSIGMLLVSADYVLRASNFFSGICKSQFFTGETGVLIAAISFAYWYLRG